MLKASGDSGSFLKVEVWKKIVGLAGLSIGFMFGMKGFPDKPYSYRGNCSMDEHVCYREVT